MATFGEFPGVRVNTQSGGITSIAVGEEEKLVIFGEALYEFDGSGNLVVDGDDAALSADVSSPEQIGARRVAQSKFGSGSELARAMQDALANGANIDFMFGVAVPRKVIEGEVLSTQSGTLANTELVENTGAAADTSTGTKNDLGIDVVDTTDGELDVELRYGGEPATPQDANTAFVNPLTGDIATDSAPAGDYEISYTFNDYGAAFGAKAVRNIVNEGETGVYATLSESDAVASTLSSEVQDLRANFQLVNALSIAEPNDSELLGDDNTSLENGGARARYDASTYSTANQSVSTENFYKFAPGRLDDERATVLGGIGGLFAGNDIENPIFNDELTGFQELEQQLSKVDADNLRAEDIIPIRSGGSVRVVGNRSTKFSSSGTVAADFFTRRLTDRVILIGKQVGDRILGRINDDDTKDAARRLIRAQLQQLVSDGLIEGNTNTETNFTVDVFDSPTNRNEVQIDISFTPFGIVKQVDETITVDTN
jgi:hypothetical protein